MTVVCFCFIFISLVFIAPYCFGSKPNHENGWENCTDDLKNPIEFETWEELLDEKLIYCIGENITKTPKTPITVDLSLELDRILNVDQSRNVIKNYL